MVVDFSGKPDYKLSENWNYLFFQLPDFHPQHLVQDDAQKADVNKLAPSKSARFSK